jgi:hypothetical protein
VEDLEAHSGKVEGGSIAHGKECIFCLGARAEMNGCVASVAQLEVSGEEVGVEVGEEDVANFEVELLGIDEVLMDIALGIDDDGGAALLISKEVGSVSEATEIVLFQDHRGFESSTAG